MNNQQIFSAGPELGKVITFACEAKSSDFVAASHQIAWYLCSGQHQRKALGFDGPLYGATLVRDTLTIYCSKWDNDEVVCNCFLFSYNISNIKNKVVYPTTNCFSLATFPTFLECYMLLCKIADHMAQEFDKVVKKWGTLDGRKELEQRAFDANNHPW